MGLDIEGLLPYATESQGEKLKAVNKFGSQIKAAKHLKCSRTAIYKAIKLVIAKATKSGYSPEHDMTHTVPEGYAVSGTSSLYDNAGNLKLQWVKSKIDREKQLELLKLAVEELGEEVRGKSIKIDPPLSTDKNILTAYPMADAHNGLYAWAEESGDDYDTDTARELTIKAMERLVAASPSSKHALVVGLGDWFHADTIENKTLKHGNILDVDTRWSRVFKIGVALKRRCIELALEKHLNVTVIIVEGNHDIHTSYCLALLMDAYFENNPRVTVKLGVSNFRYYTFGQNLIGITHGIIKPDKLPGIMACDRAEEWGNTKFRMWWTGHIHSKSVHEFPGCTVESFRTLAAKDAWTAEMGYRAGRDMSSIVLHKDYGEIQRSRVGIEQIL